MDNAPSHLLSIHGKHFSHQHCDESSYVQAFLFPPPVCCVFCQLAHMLLGLHLDQFRPELHLTSEKRERERERESPVVNSRTGASCKRSIEISSPFMATVNSRLFPHPADVEQHQQSFGVCQGGYVVTPSSLVEVSLLVCFSGINKKKNTEESSMKLGGRTGHGSRRYILEQLRQICQIQGYIYLYFQLKISPFNWFPRGIIHWSWSKQLGMLQGLISTIWCSSEYENLDLVDLNLVP